MLERRNRLTCQEIAKRSNSIQEFVINSKEFLQAKVVGAYFAFGSEVTTELIIERAKTVGKKIASQESRKTISYFMNCHQ